MDCPLAPVVDAHGKPSAVPPLKDVPTLMDIKKVLPKHCFESSLLRSLWYVALDLFLVSALFLSTRFFVEGLLNSADTAIKAGVFALYAFLQGTLFWAIFVLGHDCGHRSFSKYNWINDIVGTFLHSFILVPFHPWRLTHRYHHKNTGNIEKDEIFFPVFTEPENKSGIANFFHSKAYFGLGLGFIYYIIFGYGSFNESKPSSHLALKGHLWEDDRSRRAVLTSIVSWCLMLALSLVYGWYDGYWRVCVYYYAAVFMMCSWLVVTTFLHHGTDVPWYNTKEWNYVRGNLSSVDRDYGIFQKLTHDIGTHQIHHLFPLIPHYHLEEATNAFRKHYPHLVRKSTVGIVKSFHDNFSAYARHWVYGSEVVPEVFTYGEEGGKKKKTN